MRRPKAEQSALHLVLSRKKIEAEKGKEGKVGEGKGREGKYTE